MHAVTLKDTSEEGLTVLSKTILQKELARQFKAMKIEGVCMPYIFSRPSRLHTMYVYTQQANTVNPEYLVQRILGENQGNITK